MFGGKGGVGKTTCASATALSIAKDGHKTLVVSTDPAHSISDVYDLNVGSEPEKVFEGISLFAREIDPEKRFSENYASTAQAIFNEASKFGVDIDGSDFSGLEGGVIGSDEAAVIDLFSEYDNNEKWDYVVFDTAPTGHTLRMLELPEVLDSAFGKILDIKKGYDSFKGKITSVISRKSEDEDKKDIEDVDLEETKNRLERVGDILTDEKKTKFYVVMEAEELSLLETKRLQSQLEKNDISQGGVFVNKILKDINQDCDMCSSRYESQRSVIKKAENELKGPLFELALQKDPPRGDDLHSIADNIQVN